MESCFHSEGLAVKWIMGILLSSGEVLHIDRVGILRLGRYEACHQC